MGKKTLFKITVLIFCLISIVSCSSPTSVAEKALKLVGRGTFVPDIAEKYLDIESLNAIKLFTDYGTVFDNSLIYTEEAEHFIKYNFYKKIQQNSFFYFSDIMFSKYSLISKERINYDIKGIIDYSTMGLSNEAINNLKEAYKNLNDEYQENGSFATWTESRDVPAYRLRYNIENKHIADITVLKLPKKGYRVCSFYIE